jgi:hypothetical protein
MFGSANASQQQQQGAPQTHSVIQQDTTAIHDNLNCNNNDEARKISTDRQSTITVTTDVRLFNLI